MSLVYLEETNFLYLKAWLFGLSPSFSNTGILFCLLFCMKIIFQGFFYVVPKMQELTVIDIDSEKTQKLLIGFFLELPML